MKEEKFIELRILTGLIISTEYIQKVRNDWNVRLLESKTIKQISGWCIDYYDKYSKAPGQEIESIFVHKTEKLKDEVVEDIEDILADLSDDFTKKAKKFNVKYLYDQTADYFESRNLTIHAETILEEVDSGNVLDARNHASKYVPSVSLSDDDCNLADPTVLQVVEDAFNKKNQSVLTYPRALGTFLNDKLGRGKFIAFMGPEKRGKSFVLVDMAIRGARQGSSVAFFQAGDMSKTDQIMRVAVNLGRKSDKEKYCVEHYEPVRDCKKNQSDKCNLQQREGFDGVFADKKKEFYNNVTKEQLVKAYEENPDHRVCSNCSKFWSHKYGTPWLKKIPATSPLSEGEAKKLFKKHIIKKKLKFRISTHPNQTLTVAMIENILDRWEQEEGFIPDEILIDYVDIMLAEIKGDFRQQENHKWMRLRGLSQKRNALVGTVTQTDANSYDVDLITPKNFSEDKRKYAHVTAMYGLNQDKRGLEKEIGMIRLNEIVVRDDAFSVTNQVTVLQNLGRGIPVLASY